MLKQVDPTAKPFVVPGSIHQDAAANRAAYQWLRCLRCNCVHHLSVPLPCEAGYFAKVMKNAWCPNCDTGAANLTFAGNHEVTAALGVETTPKKAGGNVAAWLINGETGLSSKTMASITMGGNGNNGRYGISYPHDPDDLNRCIKLVKAAPEVRDAFPKIAASHPKWAVIIRHWDELVALFHGEVGEDWSKGRSAPKTYKRMQELFGE